MRRLHVRTMLSPAPPSKKLKNVVVVHGSGPQHKQATPSISCGLLPRLRRQLDHAQCEDTIVFSFLNATIDCLLARLYSLGAPFCSLSAGVDHQGAPSSCLRLTRGCQDTPDALWRRQLAAQTFKTRLKPLQKHSRAAQASVQRLRTLLESPKHQKTSNTRLFSSL